MSYDRKDVHYRRAKAAGYRARSAYKLIELDDRFHLLRAGDRVADLGAWPGAWLQVAAERVAPRGRVVGIDLVPVAPMDKSASVFFVVGDVRDPRALDAVEARLGARADVVLCDLAPKLTGIRDADEARATELCEAALHAAARLLRPGGRLATKLFMNSDYPVLLDQLRMVFDQVKTTKPQATRRASSEVYVVGLGYKPPCG